MKNIIQRLSFTHNDLYYYCLVFLAVSLPLSIFTTTLAEIFLFANWILEGDLRKKFNILKVRKAVILVISIYLIHLLGMIYTTDLEYGLHDLRIKLPILVLPLIIATSSPIKEKGVRNIMLLFSLAVLASTMISGAIFFELTDKQILDYREISIFISHIRLSLMVNLSIFSLLYFVFHKSHEIAPDWKFSILLIIVILWFIVFLFILRSITGLTILVITGFILGWKYSGKITDTTPRFITRVFLITVPLIIATYLSHTVDKYFQRDEIDQNTIERYTLNGNPYNHDFNNKAAENGHYVYLYICEKELREEWNKISKYSFDGEDKKGQVLKYTLIRYMTSLDLRKDAEGISKLTQKDIEAIENGMTNHIFLNRFSIYPRIYEIIWELDSYFLGDNPSGHSVAQRIFYLKAAGEMVSEHPILGVGTGDLKSEYDSFYKDSGSIISDKWRYRAHNQYVTFIITFGFVGFILIISAFILPVFLEKKWGDYLFICFVLIGFISMLNEDTLETQTGVSFFMFFYSLLLFGRGEIP